MQVLLLALAFILELVAFFSFAAIGYAFNISNALRLVIFVVLLVAVLMFWSLFMAPKAPKRLQGSSYYIAKAVIYTIAATSIYATRNFILGIAFLSLTFINELLLKYMN